MMILRRLGLKYFIKICFLVCLLLFYCEFVVFYIVQKTCDWPQLDSKGEDPNTSDSNEKPIKALILTDLHILHPIRMDWFERNRRDFQMKRAFQAAVHIHSPEVVFILGDLTNDGLFSYQWEWDNMMDRFHRIFQLPEGVKLYLTSGNHDIGFHNESSIYLAGRFLDTFNQTFMQLITIRDNHFVILNSVALYGDQCHLCKPAEKELTEIEESLSCAEKQSKNCNTKFKLESYSKPVLLQHYPLYRPSDMECTDFDAATLPIKAEIFNESRECLSKEATERVLKQLKPRVVFAGHTHHGCTKKFGSVTEFTLPSFSWRFKNNPNYGLAVFTPDNYAFVKCEMPKETSVIIVYVLGGLCILCYIYWSYRRAKITSSGYSRVTLSRKPMV